MSGDCAREISLWGEGWAVEDRFGELKPARELLGGVWSLFGD